jgi:hypothetical protein
MPWRQEPKKGAASCDKLRVVASKRSSADSRMGQPGPSNVGSLLAKGPQGLVAREGLPGELKHLSTPRKREYSLSSGERKGSSPNLSGSVACQPMPDGCCKARR